MSEIRIVWGTGGGPTETAAYDAALADAGVHQYNLVPVSSVLPAGPPLAEVGTAPSLGPAGHRLTVVQARDTAVAGTACAALAWAREPGGPGIVYEAAGADPDAVRREVETGLDAGAALREASLSERGARHATIDAADEPAAVVAAVVLAVLGVAEPIMDGT